MSDDTPVIPNDATAERELLAQIYFGGNEHMREALALGLDVKHFYHEPGDYHAPRVALFKSLKTVYENGGNVSAEAEIEDQLRHDDRFAGCKPELDLIKDRTFHGVSSKQFLVGNITKTYFLREFQRRLQLIADLIGDGEIDDPIIASLRVKEVAEFAATFNHKGADCEAINADELLNLSFPEIKIVVSGLLVSGLFFLVGKPKLGKSWLMLQIALAVALGGKALGSIKVDKAEVLYLALEDGRRRVQSRVKSVLPKGGKPTNLTFFTKWRTLDSGGLEDLDAWLTNHPNARLVVIDVFERLRAKQRGNVGVYAQDYRAVSPLQDLAQKHDVCIVLVHHVKKGESDDPLELCSGTNGLTGAADGTLVLRRERGQDDATLYVTGRDIEESELALNYDPKLAAWSYLGDADEFRLTPERAEILSELKRSDHECSPKEIASALGKDNVNNVTKLLRGLVKQGFASSPYYGKYTYNHSGHSSQSGTNGQSSQSSQSEVLPVGPVGPGEPFRSNVPVKQEQLDASGVLPTGEVLL